MNAKKGQPYHHGDLRRELLRVAREEVALHGAQSVSLAALSRLAGVSQPAPYRHFADREALLEAVATAAFQDFTSDLVKAVEGRRSTSSLEALALAYVTFGETNVELYRLMFASKLTPQAAASSDLNQSAGQALALLRSAMAAHFPDLSDAAVYAAWAQLHGLVMLKADGFISNPLRKFVRGWPLRLLPSSHIP